MKRFFAAALGLIAGGLVAWADNPLLRLQKTFAQIAAESKTTGLVIYRLDDPAPLVDIPAENVNKIGSGE